MDPTGALTEDQALQAAIDRAITADDPRALLDAYSRFLERHPQAGWAMNNAGLAARRLGERPLAESFFRRAINAPGFGEVHMAHSNLSMLLLDDDRMESIDHGREAVRLQPGFAQGWWNLGNALMRAGQEREAVLAFENAGRFGATVPLAQLYQARRKTCLWEGLGALEATLTAFLKERADTSPPFSVFAYLPSGDHEQLDYARRWAEISYGASAPKWSRPRKPGQKIRLGYMSADFGNHPTTHLLVSTIETHRRDLFDVVGISIGPVRPHAAGDRMRAAFDSFHDFFALSDKEAAEAIRALDLDILMDLNGYTFGCRPMILAARPAPVQINYLAWPGTMGAAFIDYIIADRVVAPDASAFSERILYLDCYQPTDPRRKLLEAPSRAALGLPEGAVVLASMNAAWKLNPPLLDVWAEILRQRPKAVLWQLAGAQTDEGLRHEARKRGVEHQLILAPHVGPEAHMARIGQADLALDTAPCGGHTTTSDMLWAGVPVLSRKGTSFAGRVAASLLTSVGLPELVVEGEAAYIEAALALIDDPKRLGKLKTYLRGDGRKSKLFDNAHYTRQLEDALLTIPL